MPWVQFLIRLMLAQFLGAAIGVERQWRQRMAGLRTNALVSTGAALFVMLGTMIPGESSPTRVVSYVVSGIGFLGGGVILREGFTVEDSTPPPPCGAPRRLAVWQAGVSCRRLPSAPYRS